MKKALISMMLLFLTISLSAQDIIHRKSKGKLDGAVVEQTAKGIRYTLSDMADSPIFWMHNSDITKIEYRNGDVDERGYQNPRKNRPLGLSLGLEHHLFEEVGYFNLHVDYFITPQIDLQLQTGLAYEGTARIMGGTHFYFAPAYSTKKFSAYTGLLYGKDTYLGKAIQLPIGVNYISSNGFQASFELSDNVFNYDYHSLAVQLKLGWRFKN